MSRAKQASGVCSICGSLGPLTFEHVPPRAAFNEARILEADTDRILRASGLSELLSARGSYKQRGAGKETLCFKCNSDTGHWYGPSYINWAIQGMKWLLAYPSGSSLRLPYHVLPLRVLKQLLAMFASACGPGFFAAEPDLRRVVLNPTLSGCPSKIRIYCALMSLESIMSRQAGITGLLAGERIKTHVFSEIAFPPFVYTLCIDSKPPDERLFDITFFSQSAFNDYRDLYLGLPVLPIVSPLPSDYRTRAEIEETLVKK